MIESPDIIERLNALIEQGGRYTSLIDKSVIPRSRALELIEVLIESLPEELEQARMIIERKEEILEEAREQAGGIVDEAVRKAESLVDADVITSHAMEKAVEIRDDTDIYVVEKLERLEHELDQLLKEVRGGMKAMGVKPENAGSEPGETGFNT